MIQIRNAVYKLMFLICWFKLISCGSLGIDFGNEFHKAAMVASGKLFHIVENKISKRKSPSNITFFDNQRFLENDALNKSLKTTFNAFYAMNKFFGKCDSSKSSPLFRELLQNLHMTCDEYGTKFIIKDFSFSLCRDVIDKTGLELDFNTEELEFEELKQKVIEKVFRFSDNKEHEYRLEEIFAMMFENLKENASAMTDTFFNSGVLTIWDNSLSILARKQLEDSLILAGISPLGFVHENLAAAVKQAGEFKLNQEFEKELIIYINIGAQDAKYSLIEFDKVESKHKSKFSLKIKNVLSNYGEKLGGNQLNICLQDIALNKFFDNIGKTRSDKGIRDKKLKSLQATLKKTKHVLSVNKESKIFVEEFLEDKDLNVEIKTIEMEEQCKTYFSQLSVSLNTFKSQIEKLDIDFNEIKKIELIGGGTRNPKTKETIREILKSEQNELYNHLNGDEAMAVGSSIIAANYTTSYNANNIILEDSPSYSVSLDVLFKDENLSKMETIIFDANSSYYGEKKSIEIESPVQEFTIELKANDKDNFTKKYIIEGTNRAIQKYTKKNIIEIKTLLHFKLSLTGIPLLTKAEVKLKEEYEKKSDSDNEIKIREHSQELLIIKEDASLQSLKDNKKEWKKSQRILSIYKMEEEKRKSILTLKNNLETAVYELREIAEENEEKRQFLTDKEKTDFIDYANTLKKFIFSGKLKETDMKEKYKEIKEMTKNFELRYFEARERDIFIDSILESLDDFKQKIILFVERNIDTPYSKVLEIGYYIGNGKEWIINARETLKNIKMFENPPILKNEIKGRLDKVKSLFKNMKKYKDFAAKKTKIKKESYFNLLKNTMRHMGITSQKFALVTKTKIHDQMKYLTQKLNEMIK